VARDIEPIYQRLGALVRAGRSARGMSQETLGKSLEPKMTRASIANIEAGHQRVFVHTAVRLGEILGINLGEALAGDQPILGSTTLESELARKLPLSRTQARTLARRIRGSEKRDQP